MKFLLDETVIEKNNDQHISLENLKGDKMMVIEEKKKEDQQYFTKKLTKGEFFYDQFASKVIITNFILFNCFL